MEVESGAGEKWENDAEEECGGHGDEVREARGRVVGFEGLEVLAVGYIALHCVFAAACACCLPGSLEVSSRKRKDMDAL